MAINATSIIGGQNRPHESHHSNNDKENSHVHKFQFSYFFPGSSPIATPIHEVQFSVFFPGSSSIAASMHAKVDSVGWIYVRKKKGKKDST